MTSTPYYLAPEVSADLLGRNAARLLGLMPGARPPEPRPAKKKPSPVITEVSGREAVEIVGRMAVSLVAEVWPETRPVFERFGIPWKDSPVPFWEPIVQAAAAKGWGSQAQRRLLDELNQAISRRPE